MKKAFRKAFAVTLSATLALSVLAGCGSSDSGSGSGASADAGAADSADASASEGSGKTDLQIIYTAEPSSFLPGSEAVLKGHMIQCNIYETLVMEDSADSTNLIS